MKVELAAQVVAFVKRLPPEPRRRVRRALRDLAHEGGDIKALEPPLQGYCRLRVGGFRVIFTYGSSGTIQCIFAEQRSLVYEMLWDRLQHLLGARGEPGRRG